MPKLITTYDKSNWSSNQALRSGSTIKAGQSFVGDGSVLSFIYALLSKTGVPTGNVVACIYAHSGTYGTSSVPTGSPLATSDPLDVSTLTTTRTIKPLVFSGANKITLIN